MHNDLEDLDKCSYCSDTHDGILCTCSNMVCSICLYNHDCNEGSEELLTLDNPEILW